MATVTIDGVEYIPKPKEAQKFYHVTIPAEIAEEFLRVIGPTNTLQRSKFGWTRTPLNLQVGFRNDDCFSFLYTILDDAEPTDKKEAK